MNNQTQQHITQWQEQNPALAQRGIDESTWGALNSTIYPGANPSSILLAIDYCRARGLDIMLKPVHLVPMNVKNSQTGQYEWRDVPMPGIGLYRIQAERSGTYAGADAPEFGPLITKRLGSIDVTFPEWCKYTVYKAIGDKIVRYSALEYWEENYASKGKEITPNAMWAKRPRGQLAKCAEAQALRKAWPEIGQEPTAEEMEGKSFSSEKDVTPRHEAIQLSQELPAYPEADFSENIGKWAALIDGGKDPQFIINAVSSKYRLTEAQTNAILSIKEVQ